MKPQLSDEELMRRAAEGDREAFAALFERYVRPLSSYINRLIGDHHLAENICQDTFVRLYERRAQYRLGAPLRPYVYTIARNLLRNQLRQRPPRAMEDSQEPALPQVDPAEALHTRALVERLPRAMGSLPTEAREIIALRHFQGLRYAEIAQIVGEPEGTLRSRYVRALAALGALLGKT